MHNAIQCSALPLLLILTTSSRPTANLLNAESTESNESKEGPAIEKPSGDDEVGQKGDGWLFSKQAFVSTCLKNN